MSISQILLVNQMRPIMISFSKRILCLPLWDTLETTLIHPCSKIWDFSGSPGDSKAGCRLIGMMFNLVLGCSPVGSKLILITRTALCGFLAETCLSPSAVSFS